MRATLILGGANLALSLLLVPPFGAVGAAMAKGAALILAAGLTTRTAVRLLDIYVNRSLFYALMPATLAAAIVLFLPPDIGPLAGGVVSILMITFALRYGRVLVKDDLRRLETVGFPRWFRSMLAVTLRVAS
jgi:O-antigen/teichoic acid export membrane protein